jgi:hypothetical protein
MGSDENSKVPRRGFKKSSGVLELLFSMNLSVVLVLLHSKWMRPSSLLIGVKLKANQFLGLHEHDEIGGMLAIGMFALALGLFTFLLLRLTRNFRPQQWLLHYSPGLVAVATPFLVWISSSRIWTVEGAETGLAAICVLTFFRPTGRILFVLCVAFLFLHYGYWALVWYQSVPILIGLPILALLSSWAWVHHLCDAPTGTAPPRSAGATT